MIAGMGGVLAAPTAAANGSAAMREVVKDLTYRCAFPLVGQQDVTGKVKITFPDSGTTGERVVIGDLHIDVTLNENIVGALRAFQTAYAEGTATADVDASYDSKELTLGIPDLHIARRDIPPSGTLTTTITGVMPSLIVYKAGAISVSAGQQFNAKVDTRKADGTPTALGVLDVPCTVKATTPPQDLHLATIPISGPNVTPARLVPTSGQVDKDLTYSCDFPRVGPTNVSGNIKATIPDSGTVGQRLAVTDLLVSAEFNNDVTSTLRQAEAATVGGSGVADVDADLDGTVITFGIPSKIPPVAVPETGSLGAQISPEIPTLIFRAPGTLQVSAGELLNGTFTPHKADGSETELGTFDVLCTVVPGQDRFLGSITITN
ncbi:DUF6801 domain-containing protein [Longimycelium tulufanense]|nr:DUF6801 domain-containing protein [Longimycelium tulufanense]